MAFRMFPPPGVGAFIIAPGEGTPPGVENKDYIGAPTWRSQRFAEHVAAARLRLTEPVSLRSAQRSIGIFICFLGRGFALPWATMFIGISGRFYGEFDLLAWVQSWRLNETNFKIQHSKFLKETTIDCAPLGLNADSIVPWDSCVLNP